MLHGLACNRAERESHPKVFAVQTGRSITSPASNFLLVLVKVKVLVERTRLSSRLLRIGSGAEDCIEDESKIFRLPE